MWFKRSQSGLGGMGVPRRPLVQSGRSDQKKGVLQNSARKTNAPVGFKKDLAGALVCVKLYRPLSPLSEQTVSPASF